MVRICNMSSCIVEQSGNEGIRDHPIQHARQTQAHSDLVMKE